MPIPYNKYTFDNGNMKFHVSRSFAEMYNPTPGIPTTLEACDGRCINGMVTEVTYTETEMILTIPVLGSTVTQSDLADARFIEYIDQQRQENNSMFQAMTMNNYRKRPEPKVSTLDPVKYAFWTVWFVILLDLLFR